MSTPPIPPPLPTLQQLHIQTPISHLPCSQNPVPIGSSDAKSSPASLSQIPQGELKLLNTTFHLIDRPVPPAPAKKKKWGPIRKLKKVFTGGKKENKSDKKEEQKKEETIPEVRELKCGLPNCELSHCQPPAVPLLRPHRPAPPPPGQLALPPPVPILGPSPERLARLRAALKQAPSFRGSLITSKLKFQKHEVKYVYKSPLGSMSELNGPCGLALPKPFKMPTKKELKAMYHGGQPYLMEVSKYHIDVDETEELQYPIFRSKAKGKKPPLPPKPSYLRNMYGEDESFDSPSSTIKKIRTDSTTATIRTGFSKFSISSPMIATQCPEVPSIYGPTKNCDSLSTTNYGYTDNGPGPSTSAVVSTFENLAGPSTSADPPTSEPVFSGDRYSKWTDEDVYGDEWN